MIKMLYTEIITETIMLKDNSKRLLCSITQERDFYAQGQLQETSMLNHTRKRLLCSRTTPRDFFCSITTERDSLNNYK